MEKRHRTQVLCTIAAVVGLHVMVVWMLWAASQGLTRRTERQGLEITFIARPPADNLAGRRIESATPRRRATANPLPMLPAAPREEESNAIHPPIDWAGELSRAAQDASSQESAQKPRDFGFPHPPSAHADEHPQFGWDYAATHRVEAIPSGGLIVHLTDNCVLVLLPLPLGACAIGKRKANGDLFKHMNEPVTILAQH
jgi:hypothetical protein